jgi:hypothetical protein
LGIWVLINERWYKVSRRRRSGCAPASRAGQQVSRAVNAPRNNGPELLDVLASGK